VFLAGEKYVLQGVATPGKRYRCPVAEKSCRNLGSAYRLRGYTPLMNLNTLYLAGMFTVNLGFFWTLIAVAIACRRRRWLAGFCQAACAASLVVRIAEIYAVIPALWWPGGAEEFTSGVVDCLGVVAASLAIQFIAKVREAKKKPLETSGS
jgi:hypothetical protein